MPFLFVHMTIMLRRTVLFALSFVGIALLTAFGVMTTVDQAGAIIANQIASYPFDILASLLTLLGNIEITGLIALVLSVLGWRREGLPGLAPLLLFAGVVLEIILKFCLDHPGPSPSRQLWNLPEIQDLPMFPISLVSALPYSFPSGHVFRITFLAEYLSGRIERYRAIARVLILATALTRVYLLEHWVSDVMGGMLLGLMLASMASLVKQPFRARLTHLSR